MTINMPEGAKEILDALHTAGYEAYIVGGCVRDSLLGKCPYDWDICTSATPEQAKEALKEYDTIDTGLKHGTITVKGEDDFYEVTTFRTEGTYSDHRRPDTVSFVSELSQDLSRRDFTINAMAYNDETGLIDPFGGHGDLDAGVIRCAGNANDRFQEDALRILRALRFSSTYGFKIAEATKAAIFTHKDLLQYVSPERIHAELNKLLIGKNACEVLLEYKNIIAEIIPEIKACIGCEQNNAYHCFDVYEHSVRAFAAYNGSHLSIKWALLLHDLGKPVCRTTDEKGFDHFYGHPAKSRELAEKVFDRLRFDNSTKNTALDLIAYHDVEVHANRRCVRRLLLKFGENQLRFLLKVIRADILAHKPGTLDSKYQNVLDAEQILNDLIKEEVCFSLKDLAVNGHDIMNLGLTQGKEVGTILNWLLNEVIEGRLENKYHDLRIAAEHKIYGIE